MRRARTSVVDPRRRHAVLAFTLGVLGCILLSFAVLAKPATADPTRRSTQKIVLEVFTRGDSELSQQAVDYAYELSQRIPGLHVVVHDVLSDRGQLSRIWKLARAAGREKPVVPAFHSCNRIYFGFANSVETGPHVQDLFTAHVYTRSTCPRCQNAKKFLAKLHLQWPALQLKIYEITHDADARSRWQQLCHQHGKLPGLPTILFAGQLTVGYQGDDVTGKQFAELLERAAWPNRSSETASRLPAGDSFGLQTSHLGLSLVSLLQAPGQSPEETPPDFEDIPLPEEALPEEAGHSEVLPMEDDRIEPGEPADVIVVPWLGELRVSKLGLPVFTFLVGLVDGFNPCAMWVLVFLLSVLVNIKDRKKIILIAGTFVFISGLAYFTFMAAWLNLFILIGMARWIQITLGVMAITIGAINVKDFFAFKKGFSLSIPESSKPGIYARVRRIVAAEYLTAALMGAVALAILVNVVELLCTAGLPALYTQVLTLHELPAWKNYAYLGLYISAYMLDDTVLLTVVVATLSHRKLQEKEGRWLKLISGLVILALGVVMIFKPTWMQLGH